MTGELHISSLVVHARPETLAAVRAAIARLPGAEVHGSNAHGKIVVTLETSSEGDILTRLDEIGRMRGVMSAVLVYHHVEAAAPAEAGSDP
jgi:nitrate reductase NapD